MPAPVRVIIKALAFVVMMASCFAQEPETMANLGHGNGLALDWATFIGSNSTASVRGITTDNTGNVYLVGGVSGPGFPTTPGAYQEHFNEGYTNTFIVKMNPQGQIIWSTLFGAGEGGDNYVYSVELDADRNPVIGGRAAPGLPTTSGTVQSDYRGVGIGGSVHGEQNSFVAKLSADGSQLLWATYLGTGGCVRDVAVADNGDIFAVTQYSPQEGSEQPPQEWFTNGFQKKPRGDNDVYIVRMTSDGKRVVAATYVSGSDWEHGSSALALDKNGDLFVTFGTSSPDMPTPNGLKKQLDGVRDMYLAKLSGDLSTMHFGTYIGGSGSEGSNTHQVALDPDGNPVVALLTNSADLPVSAGAIQDQITSNGINTDLYVVRIASDGSKLLGATYLGSYGREHWPDGPSVDRDGNIYAIMTTPSTDLPVTPDAVQKHYGGGSDDVYLAKISADFTHLIYATYLGGDGKGGSGWDDSRDTAIDQQGNLYVVGDTTCADFPIKNALYPISTGSQSGFVAKFLPTRAPKVQIWTDLTLVPVPADVVLRAKASDSDGAVVRVDFYVNGQLVGSATEPPYEYTLKEPAPGGYYAQAVVTDNAGATATSHRMEINVTGEENMGPVIIEPAIANPNPVNHRPNNNFARPINMPKSNMLQVLAVDDGPEFHLFYSWDVVAKPDGAPDPFFVDNNDQSASHTEAVYAQAGDYTFRVTVSDKQGLSATSTIDVRVLQACESIQVTPSHPIVTFGQTVQLQGVALDQFGQPMSPQPKLKWDAQGGEIDAEGVFTAGHETGEFRIKVFSPSERFSKNIKVSIVAW